MEISHEICDALLYTIASLALLQTSEAGVLKVEL
jgi:hypothetical protein